MNKIVTVVAGYVAIGAVVSIWTVSRNHEGKPSFDGFKGDESPAMTLAQCVFLWPIAVLKNFGAAKPIVGQPVVTGTPVGNPAAMGQSVNAPKMGYDENGRYVRLS